MTMLNTFGQRAPTAVTLILVVLAEMIVHNIQELAAFTEASIVDIGGPLQVANLKALPRRIVAQAEGAERRAQVAGTGVNVRQTWDANIRRQIGPRPELVRD